MALLPRRISPNRASIPGRWATPDDAQRALNAAIADIDRGRAGLPTQAGRGNIRRMSDVVEEYITARENDPTAPIAIRTARDYRGALANQVKHPRAMLATVPVAKVTTLSLTQWLGDLAKAGVPRSRIIYARALVSAALSWEVENNRLFLNPAGAIRIRSTKASRAANQSADPVLVPTWAELAALTSAPTLWRDRLLIATMGWCGLRWSEAVSMDCSAVFPDRPAIAVARVFTYDTKNGQWVREAVKAGLADMVPVPRPLWEALRTLASEHLDDEHPLFGRLLFGGSATPLDNSNWKRDVWNSARAAARLTGDPTLNAMDPRQKALKIKDLRATTASVIVDAGATRLEAASLLRHADPRTTDKHYARALADKAHDPARAALRMDPTLSLEQRINALWTAWANAYPEQVTVVLTDSAGATFGATTG